MGTLAALGTLIVLFFTWLSIQQVDDEHALTREGQVTDRYNAAVTNIGDDSLDVRLGGVYALQRIMEDSHRDQPSIVNVLSTYIRDHAKKPQEDRDIAFTDRKPTSDVQAALTALGKRDPAHDGAARVDLSGAYLSGAWLRGANLSGANLIGAHLSRVSLLEARLRGAWLQEADLQEADLRSADLRDADLRVADLRVAFLNGADLSGATLRGATLSSGVLDRANLTGAILTGAIQR
ncbi:pentapeptide repeat-containing protein [Streptomyces albogriseolus]|uniref:pentapeptide repeat-containing protein n=1 Tax=Streptomyces albogriseolus TaxID=1887 RepID=UPI00224F53FE|nr:pentapeptide repeat-containing protein [Streptomyces viridodiastaticus]MCX4618030.1 pentapeptide repeat-containing protein [Streptomyces viridodiastaticus]